MLQRTLSANGTKEMIGLMPRSSACWGTADAPGDRRISVVDPKRTFGGPRGSVYSGKSGATWPTQCRKDVRCGLP
jgi:hypothetical protein